MKTKLLSPYILLAFCLIALIHADSFANQTNPDRVNGILFYKPNCKECIELVEKDIPLLLRKNNSDLALLAINNSTQDGGTIYLESLLEKGLPSELNLPILYLNGEYTSDRELILKRITVATGPSGEVTEITWFSDKELVPTVEMKGLDPRFTTFFWVTASTNGSNPTGMRIEDFKTNFLKDPIANSLAVLVLVLLCGSIIQSVQTIRKPVSSSKTIEISNLIPILSIAAILIALYLFYSGIVDSSLVCGPVGHCNTVQQSEYSMLFEKIPVSLLGIVGYLGMILAWGISKSGRKALLGDSILTIWLLSAVSTAFFAYLTFLEPFIIGATCLWCLTVALITMTVLYLSTGPASVFLQSTESAFLKPLFSVMIPKQRK